MSVDFLGEGYELLLISRFGYLKSSMPDDPRPELQADVYKELLDYLEIESVFIFGNLAGATSAIHFAIRYPETCQGVILVAPNAPMDDRPGNPPKFIFRSNFAYWFVSTLFGKSMMGMFVPKPILNDLSRQEMKQIREDIFSSGLPINRRSERIFFDQYVSNPSIDTEGSLSSISSPALILNAADDPATVIEGAETLHEEIPDSELVIFDTGGHLLLGHEEEVKDYTREFIHKRQFIE